MRSNCTFLPGLAFPVRDPKLAETIRRAIKLGPSFQMKGKIPAFTESLDNVDEKYHDLYVEETVDNKKRFRLDADGVEDVTGLKASLKAARKERDDAVKRAEPLKDLEEGEDIEEIIQRGRSAIEAKKSGKQTPEVEQAVQAEGRKHARRIKDLENETTALTEALNESMDFQARAAINEADGNAKLLLPHVKSMLGTERIVDGDKIRYKVRVYEGEGSERTIRMGADGKPLSIDAAVAELRDNDDFADAFASRVVSGSETKPRESGMPTPRDRPPRRETAGAVADSAKEAKRATQDYTL